MKKIYKTLIFSLLAMTISAQPLSIWVTDPDNQPIVGAVLTFSPQKTHCLTDTEGRCTWPDRKSTVVVRSIGYQDHQQPLPQSDTLLHIRLLPNTQSLEEVVVSATMTPTHKETSPIPVDVFTPRFFQRNTSATLFESLSAVNGVRPQINCNVCQTGDIRINGMDGPYTMVTLDGMPIVSGLSTVYGLNGLPNGLIERVEIVKGPASTLYGSEAVGGLINIITKNALTAPRLFVETFGSQLGEHNIDIGLSAKIGRAQTLLGLNHFYFQQKIDINRDNFTDMALQKRLSVFNKWQWRRPDYRIASLAARYVQEDRWGGEMQWSPRWRGTDSIYGESIYTHRFEVIGRYQLPISSRRVLLDVSWNRHWQDAFYGTTPYNAYQQVGFTQLTTDLNWGDKHEALLGIAVRHTHYDDNTPATVQPSAVWLPGIFLQDNRQLSAQHTLLWGLRLDHHTAHGAILTPRVSWKWQTPDNQTWRATAGSGYRVANIFTEDHAALTGARSVVISEHLSPERSWNLNLNHTRKIYPKGWGFIGLDASLFYTYFSNRIVADYLSDPEKIIYKNLEGHAVSSGLSLNLDFNFVNGLKINTGATAMSVYRVDKKIRYPQLFAPPLTANWSASYSIGHTTLDYTAQLNSPMPLPVFENDPRAARSPWFSIHNIQITQRFHDLDLYIGVKNLFGFYPKGNIIMRAFDPFDKHIGVNNPEGFTFDPSYNYAPVVRQRLQVGLRWKRPFERH